MPPQALFSLVGGALFCLGLYGVVRYPHLIRKVMAFNIMSTGVALILVAIALRPGDVTPDPVPHALVLTGIVVAVSATGFALALLCRIKAEGGRLELDED